MKPLKILSFIVVPVIAWGSSSSSTTADAVATVIASISITKTQNLNFGTAAPGDNAKAVLATDATNAAAFTVSGQANKSYSITLPSTAITMTTSGSAPIADRSIDVSNFTSNPSGSGTLDGTGNQTLRVGATRDVIRATQQAGDYSGTFTVTVAYQ